MDTFEQLPVWQEARILVKDMYTALEKCRDFGFRDQLQRAAIFITNNIAEGFERVMLAEKIQFYRYAKGSAGEVRSMLYTGLDVGHFGKDFFEKKLSQVILVSQSLSNLIQSLEKYRK